MGQWRNALDLLRNISITVKFGIGIVLLLGLMGMVSVTGYQSLRYVRNTDRSIDISMEIQRLILEMDRGMETARHLHGQFFLQYPRIGLKKAHENYAQPSVRQIAQVVSISKILQEKIAKANVSEALRKSNVNLQLYLSSAKRFADTSIESLELVTRLATPETGLEVRLDESLAALNTELSGDASLKELFYKLEHFIHRHRIVRERFLMQSAFNLSFTLHNAIESNPSFDALQKEKVNLLLDTIKDLSEEILDVDVAINAKFKDFVLQSDAAGSVSTTLVDLAKKEVDKSQERITSTYRLATIILSAVSFTGLLAAGFIAWVLNVYITGRIVRLTSSTEEFRKGNLDIVAEEKPLDELGELGRTFNFMAVRIKDLVGNLEQKIEQQTQKYKESEKKYRQLVEGTEDLITRADGNGKFIFVNKACEKVFGMSADACMGKSAFQFVHEHDLQKTRKNFAACLKQKKKNAVFENQQVSKDGEIHHMIWSLNFTYDSAGNAVYVDSIGRDITQLRNTETVLQQEKERARKYLDVAGVMLVALNSAGHITLINQQGCKILNVTEQEALGRNWFDHYLPERIKQEVWAVFNKLKTGELNTAEYYENEILTSDGDERTIAFHNTILTGSDHAFEGVLFSGEDITERRRNEKEKERLESQLFQAQKMEAMGTLAGGIAHDFNNILSAIMGYADFIQQQAPAESQTAKDIQQVLGAADRAADLVKQILTFSRKADMKKQALQPHFIVKEALKMLRSTLPTSITIEEHIDPECGTILANPTNIHQVVVNLCTNARHAMTDEKGVLRVDLEHQELVAKEILLRHGVSAGQYVVLRVSDTGCGMEPKEMKRIFEPYFTTKEKGDGTGLGLSVVHGIVRNCDGFIEVESRVGEGTVFSVYFPSLDVPLGQSSVVDKQDKATKSKNRARIMVVDDEQLLVRIIQRRLEDRGYQVEAIVNSNEALEKFREQADSFDLLITDQTMPGLTGAELAQAVLVIKPSMPIIMCTGHSDIVPEANALALGIKQYLFKPLNGEELLDAVQEVLDEK